MIINSDRKFGVEIEFCTDSKLKLTKLSQRLRIEYDGSIKHIPHSGELVSNILKGASGEDSLVKSCEILKQYNAESEDPCMSMHIHLDGGKKRKILHSSKREPIGLPLNKLMIAISNKAKKYYPVKEIESSLRMLDLPITKSGHFRTSLPENRYVFYYSLSGTLKRKPLLGYTYYYLESESNFNFLQNVLYFYTKYSNVMENLVSNSRKFPNMYCVPLDKSYDINEIESLENETELRNYWYKGRETNRKRDDSRYHYVNLHSYFNSFGTIEIRSHGGTIDPNKILLWTRLHQTILDKLDNLTLEEIKKYPSDYKGFIEFVDDNLMSNYIKRLLGYFSGIKRI